MKRKYRNTQLSNHVTEGVDEKANIIDYVDTLVLSEDEDGIFLTHHSYVSVGDDESASQDIVKEFESLEELKKFRDSITRFIRGSNGKR